MYTISVKVGGLAHIQFPSELKFLGSSGNGDFPPIGRKYIEAGFTPAAAESGTLAFENDIHELTLVHYTWVTDEKLEVKKGLHNPQRAFSVSRELGLLTRRKDGGYYLTGTMSPNMDPNQYQQVGIVQMLKFLEGKINLE